MKKRNIFAAGLIVAVVTVASVSAFAAEEVVTETFEKGIEFFRGGDRGNRGSRDMNQKDGNFDNAVEEGILTEAEAIQAYHEAKAPDRSEFDGERPEGMEGRGGRGDRGQKVGNYNQAIEDGVLTEADVDAIEAYREVNAEDMEATREAMKEATEDMTREEMQTYREENFDKSENSIDLVEAGIITQEQADDLEVYRTEMQANRPEFNGEKPEGMEGRDGMRPGSGQR